MKSKTVKKVNWKSRKKTIGPHYESRDKYRNKFILLQLAYAIRIIFNSTLIEIKKFLISSVVEFQKKNDFIVIHISSIM